MTIKELIQELERFPAETRVVVQGYEDGFEDVSLIRPISVQQNPNTAWYYGQYTSATDGGEKVVLLFGQPH